MTNLFMTTVSFALLTACGVDVPTVDDPRNIVVKGKQITQAEFLQTYCMGKVVSNNCDRVKNSMSKEVTNGSLPKGW
ncbi:hypothetical protein [Noviherbaspirillum sp.]|uniref:hypothetical protein n=1 Tax=Noviherbaspirillum sp. TaxID=1926288 RepID=UPI002FE3EF0D